MGRPLLRNRRMRLLVPVESNWVRSFCFCSGRGRNLREPSAMLAALEGVTLDALEAHRADLFSSLHVEAFVHGNATAERAGCLAKSVIQQLGAKQALCHNRIWIQPERPATDVQVVGLDRIPGQHVISRSPAELECGIRPPSRDP